MTDPQPPTVSRLGGRVAARVADEVVRATLSAKQQSAGHTSKVALTVLQEFTNHVSDEVRGVLGPLWRKIADDPDTPAELAPLFRALGQQRGQAWAWIGGVVASTGVAGGLGGVFEALLAPTVHATNKALTPAVLTPADAARARATGRTAGLNIETELAATGFNADRQSVLTALAENNLAPDVVVELLRRKIIIEHDAAEALRFNGFRPADVARLLALRDVPLSPADAAAAWARSEMTEQQVDQVAALSGVSARDAAILRALAGEPPSPQELLFAWRRGIIDEATVDRGLIQGPIRNEYLPVIKNLQWEPLPVTEAADAVNQGHLTQPQAEEIAVHNGVKREDFAVIVANAGIPPGPSEAVEWLNRGLITEAEFTAMFLESRIKNKYVHLYLEARHKFLTLAEIRLLVARGALSKEDAIRKLQQVGFTAEDSASIVLGATAEKTQSTKDLTVANVRALYADRSIDRAQATDMLTVLGYDDEEAAWELAMADMARVRRFETAAVNRVHAAYVKGILSDDDATAQLDTIGMPPEQRDDVIRLWQYERATPTRTLTLADLKAALKRDIITRDDFVARVSALGYDDDDTQVQLRLAT